jgi:hypothetical protein
VVWKGLVSQPLTNTARLTTAAMADFLKIGAAICADLRLVDALLITFSIGLPPVVDRRSGQQVSVCSTATG